MIITRFTGGLGNQMFQYAFGYALSRRLDVKHKLNTSKYQTYKLHKFSLDQLQIEDSTHATRKELASPVQIHERSPRKGLVYSPKLNFNTNQNYMVSGYWVGEKWFAEVADDIRKQYLPRTLTNQTKQLAEQIKTSNSVSLHVRRKDYTKIRNVRGICDVQYYVNAIKTIQHVVDTPTFYVFSDDVDWVKNNLNFSGEVVYSYNGPENNHQDLYLMSLCTHNIIANSTFSWWGAWLNNNKNKVVVYPKKWGHQNKVKINDIIPNQWRKRISTLREHNVQYNQRRHNHHKDI